MAHPTRLTTQAALASWARTAVIAHRDAIRAGNIPAAQAFDAELRHAGAVFSKASSTWNLTGVTTMRPPNDERAFVHRRIIAGVGGFVTGGPGGAVRGFLQGSRGGGGQPIPSLVAPSGPCRPGQVRFGNTCVDLRALPPGGDPAFTPAAGVASGMMGGVTPLMDQQIVRRCLPGMVLGRDGLCYMKGSIPNKSRMWPKGRRPLGTPGELAALAKAASFGRRMENTVKRMQKIGVLKKPSRGRARARPQQRLLGPGGPSIINVE